METTDQLAGRLYIDLYAATLQSELPNRYLAFRTILETLFAELTRPAHLSFDDLYKRSLYVFKLDSTPRHIQQDIHFVRITANKLIHPTGYELAPFDDGRCIRGLSRAIQHFSGVSVPDLVQGLIDTAMEGYVEPQHTPHPFVERETYTFTAFVKEVYPPKEGIPSRKLVCENDEWGEFHLFLWDNRQNGEGSDLTPLADLLEELEFPRIYVEGAMAYNNRPNAYYATKDAYVVLEPDYLIEAKKLATCVQDQASIPELFLMDRFEQSKPNENMLLGMLVGSRMDDIHRHPNTSYKDSYTSFQKENALSLLILATQAGKNYNREMIENIYKKGLSHEPNLQIQAYNNTAKKAHLEPHFISAEFGLVGKMDILYEDANDSSAKQILELKSGKQPTNGTIKPEHEHQALGYELLQQSVFPGHPLGDTHILYSQCPEHELPLRKVAPNQTLKKQQLLMLRNQIVASELLLSRGDMKPLVGIRRLATIENSPLPWYNQATFVAFNQKYSQLNTLDRAYFEEFVAFAYREMRIAKLGQEDGDERNGGQAALWKKGKMEKIQDFDTLVNLTIIHIADNSVLTLRLPGEELFSASVSALRPRDPILLYPTPDPEVLHPLRSQLLKGRIQSIDHQQVTVVLSNKQVDSTFFTTSRLWAVEKDFSDSTYKQWLQSLYRFMCTTPEVRQRVLGLTEPRFEDTPYEPVPALNENQNDIIRRAIQAQDYFLIQGPPGTGKTSQILTNIVAKLLEKRETILILAFTNRAVDEICLKLDNLPAVNYLRLGRNTGGRSFQALAETQPLDLLHAELRKANIIISTINSFVSSSGILDLKRFDTLIVDEASQVTEPHLIGWMDRFGRFILIGDEKQLPPVVVQDMGQSAALRKELYQIQLPNLRESMFNRLLQNAKAKGWSCYGLLKVHYRMHRDVAHFVNYRFYGGQLQHCHTNAAQSNPIHLFDPQGATPLERALATNRVLFIPSIPENTSKVNEFEAAIALDVVKLVKEKMGTDFKLDTSIGVITPFRAQMATIRKKLGTEFQDVTVDTVERYQGSERDIILISFAIRSHGQLAAISAPGPDDVDRKLNVALSRARQCVILTGSEDILRASPHHAALLDYIKEAGGYLSPPGAQ